MLLLVVKVPTILVPLLWGEALLLSPIEVTCLVVGLLSGQDAKYLRDGLRSPKKRMWGHLESYIERS